VGTAPLFDSYVMVDWSAAGKPARGKDSIWICHWRRIAGTMTPLVMVNNIKSPNFPQVPTLVETGYSGPPSRSWYGLFTPAGTPRAIVDRLAKEVASIVADPAFRERHLSARSLVPAINTPEQFAADIKKDRAQAQEVVKASGLEPQ